MKQAGAEEVFGVDKSEEAIRYAEERYSSDGIEYVIGDAVDLYFEDALLDVVVSFETLEHLLEYRAFFREVRRILKLGGIFLCSTPNPRFDPNNTHHLAAFSLRH